LGAEQPIEKPRDCALDEKAKSLFISRSHGLKVIIFLMSAIGLLFHDDNERSLFLKDPHETTVEIAIFAT
jgi:hypothetical protein